MSSKDENENENEHENGNENGNENENENENKNENGKTLMSSEDLNKNAKNKKNSTNTKKATNKNKDENKNMLLEYMKDIDDKLFKKCIHGKDVKSFIKEFDCATNEKDKEKLVKELKDINGLVQITLKWRLILVNTNVNYLIL